MIYFDMRARPKNKGSKRVNVILRPCDIKCGDKITRRKLQKKPSFLFVR